MSMEADQRGRLRDILHAAKLIAAYVEGCTEADFGRNAEKQDAVVRRIGIIGEAAAHLTEDPNPFSLPRLLQIHGNASSVA